MSRREYRASKPCQVKPFFMVMVTAPPSAFSPKIGFPATIAVLSIAFSGMSSQLTVSPNASLMRTPF